MIVTVGVALPSFVELSVRDGFNERENTKIKKKKKKKEELREECVLVFLNDSTYRTTECGESRALSRCPNQ